MFKPNQTVQRNHYFVKLILVVSDGVESPCGDVVNLSVSQFLGEFTEAEDL